MKGIFTLELVVLCMSASTLLQCSSIQVEFKVIDFFPDYLERVYTAQ